ncbi:MAG: hypothetical protein ACRDN0_08470 [Trebonia sp.]
MAQTRGAETRTGNGVEVVLSKQDAIVSVNTTLGTALQSGQTSIQATGSDAAELLNLVKGGGHIKTTLQLLDNGTPVHLTPNTQASTANWVPWYFRSRPSRIADSRKSSTGSVCDSRLNVPYHSPAASPAGCRLRPRHRSCISG